MSEQLELFGLLLEFEDSISETPNFTFVGIAHL